MTNEETVWTMLRNGGLSEAGAAAMMGNLYAESALKPNNLQNTYNTRLSMSDDEYTDSVDSGVYTGFTTDRAGYGLAQWTKGSRKEKLLAFSQKMRCSIGNLEMQVLYLLEELQTDYRSIYRELCEDGALFGKTVLVLKEFENPANQGTDVQDKRFRYAEGYYEKFKGKILAKPEEDNPMTVTDFVKVPRELVLEAEAVLQKLLKYAQQ